VRNWKRDTAFPRKIRRCAISFLAKAVTSINSLKYKRVDLSQLRIVLRWNSFDLLAIPQKEVDGPC
jgi:hypothetical protein